jgi:Domain of unknown function (DUF4835)
MHKIFVILLFLNFGFSFSQELKCIVRVNGEKLPPANQKPLKTLETSLNEFLNNTIWSSNNFKQNEKINCSISINIDSFETDVYVGTIQVQSSRTAFNSTYSTPIFNLNDKDLSFRYLEFETFNYNPASFDTNLISVLSFYANLIIGLDQDSLSLLGGTKSFEVAQNILNNAQASGNKGWTQNDGNNSRYFLINDLMSDNFSAYRTAMYEYNLHGIDIMEKNPRIAKEKIIESLKGLKKIYDFRPNSYLMRVFFDSKGDEIVSIFSGGPKVQLTDLIDDLNKFAPLNNEKWNAIKN